MGYSRHCARSAQSDETDPCGRVLGGWPTTQGERMMSKRTMQWMGMGLAAILLVAGLVVVSPPAARSQGEGAPTIYTFVSEFAVPRASWAQFSEDTDKNFVPLADKAVADGTILGYTTFESVVHTPEGY